MTAIRSAGNNPASDTPDPLTIANLVVPLDGGTVCRSSLPVAKLLARLYQATPHLVYAGEQLVEPNRLMQVLGVTNEDLPGAVLDSYQGDPGEAILQASQGLRESVIVMCTHTSGSKSPERFGSVLESVLARAPERIILIAPAPVPAAWAIHNVLLAHDGSPGSERATAAAADVAHRAGAHVIALHVAAAKTAAPPTGSVPAPRYLDQPQHEWPTWATEFMNRMMALGAAPSSLQFKLVVAGGQPGSEISKVARDRQADLVVMTCDGQWQSAKHMATRVVIRSAGCPVLLVFSPRQG